MIRQLIQHTLVTYLLVYYGINCLNSAYLKSVLLYHNLPAIGINKQLVLRTYLLRRNRIADIVARQECQRNDLTNITQKVILEQR